MAWNLMKRLDPEDMPHVRYAREDIVRGEGCSSDFQLVQASVHFGDRLFVQWMRMTTNAAIAGRPSPSWEEYAPNVSRWWGRSETPPVHIPGVGPATHASPHPEDG